MDKPDKPKTWDDFKPDSSRPKPGNEVQGFLGGFFLITACGVVIGGGLAFLAWFRHAAFSEDDPVSQVTFTVAGAAIDGVLGLTTFFRSSAEERRTRRKDE